MFNTSIYHDVGNYYFRIWGTGISDAIVCMLFDTVCSFAGCHSADFIYLDLTFSLFGSHVFYFNPLCRFLEWLFLNVTN